MSLTRYNAQRAYIDLPMMGPVTDQGIISHIRNQTGLDLEMGRTTRLNQAVSQPTEYLEDKQLILNAIVAGHTHADPDAIDGNALLLNIKLPGKGLRKDTTVVNNVPAPNDIAGTDYELPELSSLADEWKNSYNTLFSSGMPDNLARLEADALTKDLINKRLYSFSLSFPGLVGDGYLEGLNQRLATKEVNAVASGIVPPHSRKHKKYKKYKKHYKASKQSKT